MRRELGLQAPNPQRPHPDANGIGNPASKRLRNRTDTSQALVYSLYMTKLHSQLASGKPLKRQQSVAQGGHAIHLGRAFKKTLGLYNLVSADCNLLRLIYLCFHAFSLATSLT
jgi:hypothetical protein